MLRENIQGNFFILFKWSLGMYLPDLTTCIARNMSAYNQDDA